MGWSGWVWQLHDGLGRLYRSSGNGYASRSPGGRSSGKCPLLAHRSLLPYFRENYLGWKTPAPAGSAPLLAGSLEPPPIPN
eukprot:382625-Prorocentrum_lima.AAC.1